MQSNTVRQDRFCDEYIVDYDAVGAMIRAGYSESQSKQRVKQMLVKPHVQAKIRELEKARLPAKILTQEWVASRLQMVAERCLSEVNRPDGEPYKFDAQGASRALELLGRHLAMFTDKVEVEVTDSYERRLDALDEAITVVIEAEPEQEPEAEAIGMDQAEEAGQEA